MSSPAQIHFTSFIKIDRRKEDAIYMQIVYQFIHAVKMNLLEDGDLLPGSRKMAGELQVHRKTIIAALAELQGQGWIKTRPNIGTFVRNPELSPDKTTGTKAFRQPPEKAPFHFRKEFILDTHLPENPGKFYFTDGTPDNRIIAPEELVRFYASALKRKRRTAGFSADENLFFRDQLSYYLNLTRGFHLSRNFLLPVAGQEQIFSILARLLIHTGDIVLVENLSYFLPNMIFSHAGAKLKTIPVDAGGMDISYIQKHFKPGEIRFVYINPQSQYPTTAALTEERKIQLLHLAERYDFIVVEDDSDFEFSPIKDKSASLFRKNDGVRVLYIGAFGRFLNPGFQTHFLIAPKDLLEESRKYLNIFGKPDPMKEKALGEIIRQGDIHRYRRKAQKVVSERKEMFARLFNTYFEDRVTFSIPSSGLAFWVQFNDSLSLIRLQEKAKEKGVLIPGICLYQNRGLTALRLGFAHLNQTEMEETTRLFAEAYEETAG